jgi:hypothetical protein
MIQCQGCIALGVGIRVEGPGVWAQGNAGGAADAKP